MDPDTIRRAPSRARCLRFGHARRVVVAVELHTIADETTPGLVGALRRFDDVSITRGRVIADKRRRTYRVRLSGGERVRHIPVRTSSRRAERPCL